MGKGKRKSSGNPTNDPRPKKITKTSLKIPKKIPKKNLKTLTNYVICLTNVAAAPYLKTKRKVRVRRYLKKARLRVHSIWPAQAWKTSRTTTTRVSLLTGCLHKQGKQKGKKLITLRISKKVHAKLRKLSPSLSTSMKNHEKWIYEHLKHCIYHDRGDTDNNFYKKGLNVAKSLLARDGDWSLNALLADRGLEHGATIKLKKLGSLIKKKIGVSVKISHVEVGGKCMLAEIWVLLDLNFKPIDYPQKLAKVLLTF